MDAAMAPPVSAAQAGVRATLEAPPTLTAGQPVRLVYRLAQAQGGAPFTDVVVSHEELMHLIVVRRDLLQFQHIHPLPTGTPGEYAVDVTFPTPGTYTLYDEFARHAGPDVLLRDTLTVGAPSGPAALAPDRTPKVLGDTRVALEGVGDLRAGQPATLTFRLEDAQTGEGLTNLRPYLGAAAHVVVISADGQTFIHAHGEQPDAGMAMGHAAHADGPFGPEIAAPVVFPHSGLYKIWGQFNTAGGQLVTAAFVTAVQ
jgi:Cu+-exporting ATPase